MRETLRTVFTRVLDIIRPSRREDVIIKLRPYQNIKAPVASSYTFIQYNAPEMTNHKTIENRISHTNITGSN